MSTSQENHSPSNEIDLIEMLTQLWEARITILLVSGLCGILSLGILFLAPKYVGEFVVRGPVGSQLAAYAPVNDNLDEHYRDFLRRTGNSDTEQSMFEISADGLVWEMVRELQDYAEFEQALRQYSVKIRDMSDEKYRDERSDLLSDFAIRPTTEGIIEARVTFEWGDEDQLLDILTQTLASAETNLNANKTAFLKGLSDNIERRIKNELLHLDRNLQSVRDVVDLETERRLLVLNEQASIARALDLAENNLAAGAQENQYLFNIAPRINTPKRNDRLDASEQDSKPSLPAPEALYLRGYKSLEAEIALIEARTPEQNYLLNSDFLDARRKSIELVNNASVELFQNAINASPFASDASVFGVSRAAIQVDNKRNVPLIVAFSLILGFFASCAFVVIKTALLRHQSRLTS